MLSRVKFTFKLNVREHETFLENVKTNSLYRMRNLCLGVDGSSIVSLNSWWFQFSKTILKKGDKFLDDQIYMEIWYKNKLAPIPNCFVDKISNSIYNSKSPQMKIESSISGAHSTCLI